MTGPLTLQQPTFLVQFSQDLPNLHPLTLTEPLPRVNAVTHQAGPVVAPKLLTCCTAAMIIHYVPAVTRTAQCL